MPTWYKDGNRVWDLIEHSQSPVARLVNSITQRDALTTFVALRPKVAPTPTFARLELVIPTASNAGLRIVRAVLASL
ncbi:MAG: hypothetical protein WAL64_05075 [Candidatus Dormiibacterota bacterium]